MSKEITLSYDKSGKLTQTSRSENGEHSCSKEEFLGQVKEFMENMKGLKATMFVISMTILLQVGTFLYLWGGQGEVIKSLCKDRDVIMSKLTNIKIVYAQGEKDDTGKIGATGATEKDYDSKN